jgi:Xaa-Pro aminopeptidase
MASTKGRSPHRRALLTCASPERWELSTYPHQADRLTESLDRGSLEALVATSPEHVVYMTGFRPPGPVVAPAQTVGVFTRHGVALVVSISHASALLADTVDVDHIVCYGWADPPGQGVPATEVQRLPDVVVMPAGGPVEAVAAALERLGVRGGAIGLDESGLSFEGWRRFTERLSDMKAVQAGARLADARRVKGPYEIECLNHALRITEEALDAVIQTICR